MTEGIFVPTESGGEGTFTRAPLCRTGRARGRARCTRARCGAERPLTEDDLPLIDDLARTLGLGADSDDDMATLAVRPAPPT